MYKKDQGEKTLFNLIEKEFVDEDVSKIQKALTKKSIGNLQKNAENMSDKDFRKQGSSVLGALTNVVQKAMEDGKVASQHFFNGVNKEIDILSKYLFYP